MTKKKLKGPKNQWEARLSKHNGVTGVLGDSRFGTALFTRLQLWTMLGEESARITASRYGLTAVASVAGIGTSYEWPRL